MFRLWAKMIVSGKMVKNMTIGNSDSSLNRTKKIFSAIDEVCYAYDLSKPIWLDKNINEFKKNSKTRFTKDNFVDDIDFDSLDIEVIEED
ncbi:hypothetical protein GCWU000282_01231 [Catonella morbi ATCC 51271]|uniref:Uncharacterized protein n=1 Tax=Catonella morbi ATCC 51271 TaxID=592026 RepID=V2XMW2_9FIRM|nr:hypothetical protein [Catonella morbi]ESL03519.1 hypothetical protein GCWU000282_01231 [Catonella morbi ATCC 51271]